MKNWILFLVILITLVAAVSFIIEISNQKYNENNEINSEENQNNEITGNIIKDDSENNVISGNAIGGGGGSSSSGSGGSGGAGGGSGESGGTQEKQLPSDLYTKPCSFYFLEYGVCAGVCPNGQCLIDEKSCYCRTVE